MISTDFLGFAIGGLVAVAITFLLVRGMNKVLRAAIVLILPLAAVAGVFVMDRHGKWFRPAVPVVPSASAVTTSGGVPPRSLPSPVPFWRGAKFAERLVPAASPRAGLNAPVWDRHGVARFVFPTSLAVAFLYVGYLFVAAGTRGRFAWPLRIASTIGFAGLLFMVAIVRHRL